MRAPLLLPVLLLTACPASGPTEEPVQTKSVAASQPASRPSSPHDKIVAGPPGQPVAGVIKLGEGLDASAVKPTDVLFIMARESKGGGRGGRLVAVQRHGRVELPKRFELTSQDAMIPGIPFKGPFVVHARLDRDGDPMTRGADDLYGAVPEEVASGREDLTIILKPKAAGPASAPASAPAPKTE